MCGSSSIPPPYRNVVSATLCSYICYYMIIKKWHSYTSLHTHTISHLEWLLVCIILQCLRNCPSIPIVYDKNTYLCFLIYFLMLFQKTLCSSIPYIYKISWCVSILHIRWQISYTSKQSTHTYVNQEYYVCIYHYGDHSGLLSQLYT